MVGVGGLAHDCDAGIGDPSLLGFVEFERRGAALHRLTASIAKLGEAAVVLEFKFAAFFEKLRIVGRAAADAGAAGLVEVVALVFDPIGGAVYFADSGGGVAEAAKVAEDIGQAAGIAAAEAVVAVVVAILAGKEGNAAGRADGVLSDAVFEAHTLCSHAVEVWGLHLRVADVGENLGIVLVGYDEENIGAVAQGAPAWSEGRSPEIGFLSGKFEK